VLQFANTDDKNIGAKNAEAFQFVATGERKTDVKNAAAFQFANTDDRNQNVKIAAGVRFVVTGESNHDAKIAGVAQFANMDERNQNAKRAVPISWLLIWFVVKYGVSSPIVLSQKLTILLLISDATRKP